MVRSLAQRFTAWFVAVTLLAAALPVAASAQATGAAPTEAHYDTAITTAYGSPYPVAGHLDLQIFADGHLRGYYHNAYQKAFIQVTGGRDGNYIWFDIGPNNGTDFGIGLANPGGRLHVVATMGTDGAFKGQLYPLYAGNDLSWPAVSNRGINGSDANIATGANAVAPAPAPTVDDQYIFAAKPVDKSSEDYPFTTTP